MIPTLDYIWITNYIQLQVGTVPAVQEVAPLVQYYCPIGQDGRWWRFSGNESGIHIT